MSEYVIKTEKEIKSCYDCPFCSANDDLDSEDYRSMYCSFPNIGEFVTDYDACRHPNCPLKELPEHGDLGDISDLYANLMADIQTNKIENLQDVIRIINEKFENAPVILKANYKED